MKESTFEKLLYYEYKVPVKSTDIFPHLSERQGASKLLILYIYEIITCYFTFYTSVSVCAGSVGGGFSVLTAIETEIYIIRLYTRLF